VFSLFPATVKEDDIVFSSGVFEGRLGSSRWALGVISCGFVRGRGAGLGLGLGLGESLS